MKTTSALASLSLASVMVAAAATSADAIPGPATSYGQTSQCQILGAGNGAPTFYAGYGRTYPVEFIVRTAGTDSFPLKRIHVKFTGAGQVTYDEVLDVTSGGIHWGSAFREWLTRTPVPKNGQLGISMSYPGDATHVPCGASITVTIRG